MKVIEIWHPTSAICRRNLVSAAFPIRASQYTVESIRPQTWIVKLWNRSYRHQTKQAEKYVATLSQYTESTLQFFWTRISTTLVTSNTWIVTQLGWIPANLQSTILPLTFLRLNPSSTHGCKAKGKFHFPNNFLSTQNRTTMESLTTQESISWGLFPPPQSTTSNPC